MEAPVLAFEAGRSAKAFWGAAALRARVASGVALDFMTAVKAIPTVRERLHDGTQRGLLRRRATVDRAADWPDDRRPERHAPHARHQHAALPSRIHERYPFRVDACATLLNVGTGTIRFVVRHELGNSSADVEPDLTRTVCASGVFSVTIQYMGAPCSFEWRVDQAAVITVE